MSGVLEYEIRVGKWGEEHREGELVTVALTIELLGVFEEVDEGVDELGRVVLVGHHGVGLHLTQVTVPDMENIFLMLLELISTTSLD